MRCLEKEEVVFLKRKFVMHPEMKCFVAPLDTDSIWKALIFEPKNVESVQERMKQVFEDGQREFFLHGKEKFLEFQRLMNDENQKLLPFRRYGFVNLEFDKLVEAYNSDLLFATPL